MASNLRPSSLIPAGLIVDDITESETALVVSARAKASAHACRRCGALSSRVDSRYVRMATDLPCAGKKVELWLNASLEANPAEGLEWGAVAVSADHTVKG